MLLTTATGKTMEMELGSKGTLRSAMAMVRGIRSLGGGRTGGQAMAVCERRREGWPSQRVRR